MSQFKKLFNLKRISVALAGALLIGGAAAGVPKQALAADSSSGGMSCRVLPELFKAYLFQHVSVRALDDTLKDKTIDQYLKNLDGSKTMLLQADVDKIKKDLKGVFQTMQFGNCSALDETQKLVAQRAAENEAFVKSFLNDKYKVDETVQFTLDPEKRSFPKTDQERQDLLKKFVHFQISNYLMTDMKLKEAKTQLIHRYELVTKRLKERDSQELLNVFADSFAAGMDPHSSYLSKDRLEDFQIDMRLSLEGIGASLSSQDGYTVVEEVIPGGAADRAKVLQTKDKIIAVGQNKNKPVNVIDMELRDVVKLIRGKKGTKVHLTLLRQQGTDTKRVEVSIVRDKVDLAEQAAKIRFDKIKQGNKQYKIGIIELPSFYGDSETGKRSSYDDMKKLLVKANKEKVDGIILNLSRNGGGLLDDAVKISGLFIKEGPVVATQNSRGSVDILADKDESIEWSGPLVLLTSRISASASEILAGALKDYKRALIVGADHTFGKGTVQAVIPLPKDLGAMKVTTGMFFLPGGISTQHKGVAADVTLPNILNNEEIGEKALDNSLPPAKIASFMGTDANFTAPPMKWTPVDPTIAKALAQKSAERVNKDPKFAEIKKDIADAEKNKGVINLAEIKSKFEADKKKNKADEKKTVNERIRDADAPIIHETENILADYIDAQRAQQPGMLLTGAPSSEGPAVPLQKK
jgi:carboxyl-terminal processing protease